MLHYSTVDTPTLELLKKIQANDLFSGLRLAGGTSLSLQVGHRKSIDLDFFGIIDADSVEITNALSEIGKTIQLKNSKNINIYLVDGVKVDVVNYKYPWLDKNLQIDDIKLAGKKDIAAMKLAAVTGRGTKKDVWDIFYLLKEFSLVEMIGFYEQKYPDGSSFLALKSLIYFDDAEQDADPLLTDNQVDWAMVKQTISIAHKDYMNKL